MEFKGRDETKDIVSFYLRRRTRIPPSLLNFLIPNKTVPSLSFICIEAEFENISSPISWGAPTVIVQERETTILRYSERKILAAASVFINKPCLFESLLHERRRGWTAIECFHTLHVNGHTLDYKIVVTNWKDRNSKKPDLKCTEYPIKAFIQLLKDPRAHQRRIKKLLEGTSFHVSQAVVEPRSRLFYYDPDSCRTFGSGAITIAFAGQRVQSAVYHVEKDWGSTKPGADRIRVEHKIQERVKDFQDKLEFPIDDGRVLGFLFQYFYDQSGFAPGVISDLFPSINLVKIKCDPVHSSAGEMAYSLHLIRI